jgi:nicotinate-nucleotide adenylyltransferase
MKREIGIYPGTFDPVHDGHIEFAKAALSACQLDQVFFLPEPKPRNKPNAAHVNHRVEALRDTLGDNEKLGIFTPESDTYTIKETLPKITDSLDASNFTMLVGSDVFKTIDKWSDLEILVSGIKLAVGLRGNDTAEDIHSSARALQEKLGIEITYRVIEVPETRHISSSQIRGNR